MKLSDNPYQWRQLLGDKCDDALSICQAFERVAAQLAPIDLAAMPFYAMPVSKLGAFFRTTTKYACGYFHPDVAGWLRDHVDWRGDGIGVVWNDVNTADGLEQWRADAVHRMSEQEATDIVNEVTLLKGAEVLLHELAHGLDFLAMGKLDQPETDRSKLLASFAWLVESNLQTDVKPAVGVEYHDLRFIRVMVHLHYRLCKLGVSLPPDEVRCAGSLYGQSGFGLYVDAFGYEPGYMADLSFREIMAEPFLTDAVTLWQFDQAQRTKAAA